MVISPSMIFFSHPKVQESRRQVQAAAMSGGCNHEAARVLVTSGGPRSDGFNLFQDPMVHGVGGFHHSDAVPK